RHIRRSIMNSRSQKELNTTEQTLQLPRRKFLCNAVIGIAGASVTLFSADSTLARSKDSGEIVLDALMWSYVAAPVGSSGSHWLSPGTGYSMTIGLESQQNRDISLRASVPAGEERLRGDVSQIQSGKIPHAIALSPRAEPEDSFSIASIGGDPQNTSFFGMCRPVLRFKGNGKKAQFRLVNAECIMVTGIKPLWEPGQRSLSPDTAASWIAQYETDPTKLVEPRFQLIQTVSGGQLELTMRAQSDPPDVSAVVTARILDQSGFNTDALKDAFAVGTNLEVTHFSAQDSGSKLVNSKMDFQGATGTIRIFL